MAAGRGIRLTKLPALLVMSGHSGLLSAMLGKTRFASPRNDATLGLNAAEPQPAVIGLPFDFRWVSPCRGMSPIRAKAENMGSPSNIFGFGPN
jgi:hypothetical protein